MTNNNFAKLVSAVKLEYAPTSFKTDKGMILMPTREMYLKRGWYEVIDIMPEPMPDHYVQFSNYTKDDINKTITAQYVQMPNPVVKKTYSKLKLEAALFKINKLNELDQFLDETTMKNEFGGEIALRRLYDQANDLKEDNEYFDAYFKLAKEKLGIDDETAQKLLEQCIIDLN